MITKLSYNSLGIIFKFLQPHDILRFERLCKKFKEVAQMDHIWRSACLFTWPFVHNYRNETWRGTYKRKKLSQFRMETGEIDDYIMIPLRAHKNYVTALHVMEEGILSGDVDGDIIHWIEDDTEYAKEDPEAFTPKKIWTSSNEIKKFLIHPSKKFITAFALDNTLEVFSFNSEERKIEHKSTIKTEGARILYIEVYEDNVLVFCHGQPEILVYNCGSGLCIQRIALKERTSVIEAANIESQAMLAIWRQYLFIPCSKTDEYFAHQKTYFIDKHDLKNNKVVGTFNLPSACQVLTISGDTLIVIMKDKLLFYDPNTLKELCSYNFVQISFNYCSVITRGPVITTYLVGTQDFDIRAYNHNPRIKKHDAIKLKVAHKEEHKLAINSVDSFENKLATASCDMTVAIWDMLTGSHLYRLYGNININLIGGSLLVKPKSFVENPNKAGIAIVKMNEGRIAVAIGNLIRVYAFDVVQ